MCAGEYVLWLEGENERLEAIVARLPHTGDGVPLVIHAHPYVWVHCRRAGLYRPGEGVGWWRMRVDGYEEPDRLYGWVEGSHVESFATYDCFSTQAAGVAEKAWRAGRDRGGETWDNMPTTR